MGLFDFFKKKTSINTNKQNSSDLSEDMDKLTTDIVASAEFFVSSSSNKFKGLDFSIKSLELVDVALAEASNFYKDMTEQEQRNLVSVVGSYIFEVARRGFGGKYLWYDPLNQPILVVGKPEFEASILAYEKVKGRLTNGIEDNIPFYFSGFVDRVKRKQSGLIV